MVHDKEVHLVDATVEFLDSYLKSTSDAKLYNTKEILKGKMSALLDLPKEKLDPVQASPWPPLPSDHVTLSVDGSFSDADILAATGMILRHYVGSFVLAVYQCVFNTLVSRWSFSRTPWRPYPHFSKSWFNRLHVPTFCGGDQCFEEG